MDWRDAIKIGATILASLGGGGLIVLGLSSWLGKVWATHLMESERQAHAIELENLRNSLQRLTETELRSLDVQLEIRKKDHLDRVTIYRSALDLLAEILAKVVMVTLEKRGPLTPEELLTFETERLRVYAYLAMHAPQSVMDAHDAVMDLTLALVADGKPTTWPQVRELSLRFLNEVREDIGINKAPVAYNGTR
jgi:hypothetical protein